MLSKIVWFVVPDRISQIDTSVPEFGIESCFSMQGSWSEVANLVLLRALEGRDDARVTRPVP